MVPRSMPIVEIAASGGSHRGSLSSCSRLLAAAAQRNCAPCTSFSSRLLNFAADDGASRI
jgi:hypothetical protein